MKSLITLVPHFALNSLVDNLGDNYLSVIFIAGLIIGFVTISTALIIDKSWAKLVVFCAMTAIITLMTILIVHVMPRMESFQNFVEDFRNITQSTDSDANESNIEESTNTVFENAPDPVSITPLDWTPLIIGGGILLGAAGLGMAGRVTYGGVKAGKAARRRKLEEAEEKATAKKESIRRWDTMRESYQSVMSRYAEYETDVWKALKYPALHDANDEKTSAFLKQLCIVYNVLKEQEDQSMGSIGGSDELYQKIFVEVNSLSHLFETAEKNALKMEWKTLPSDEKKDLKQATQLLKHAENEGNSPAARQTYYEQLQKIINRLNSRHTHDIIPTATVKSLTSGKDTLLLTDGNSNESMYIEAFLKAQEEIVEESSGRRFVLEKVPFKNRFQKIRDKVSF